MGCNDCRLAQSGERNERHAPRPGPKSEDAMLAARNEGVVACFSVRDCSCSCACMTSNAIRKMPHCTSSDEPGDQATRLSMLPHSSDAHRRPGRGAQ